MLKNLIFGSFNVKIMIKTDKNNFKNVYIVICCFIFVMIYTGSNNLLLLKIASNQSIEYQIHNLFQSYPLELKNNKNFLKHNKDLLVTMFTTFSEGTKKMSIFQNTMRIWALLKPLVQPVLYCHSNSCLDKWRELAEIYGWHSYKAPASNKDRIPFLKHMYLHALRMYNSSFYGYCNGDILFDETFLKNFYDLEIYAKENENILVIGQRSNYHMKNNKTFSTFNEVREAYKNATLFTPWAIDYFIYTKNSIDWETIPNFVVGKW